MAEIELLPAAAASDAAVVEAVCGLVNRAYEIAEQGLWQQPYERTTPVETADAIARGELAIARLDGHIVGSICTRQLDNRTGWFGALAVDPAHGGRSIGGKLVRFAEQHASAAGSRTMQLELLVTQPSNPHTDFLRAWYERLGYRQVERRELADVDPAALAFLTVACEVAVLQKPLA